MRHPPLRAAPPRAGRDGRRGALRARRSPAILLPPGPQPRPSLAAGGGAAARRPFCGAARSVALGSARSGARGRCSAVINPFSRTDPSVRARRRPGGPGPRRPPARSALRARGEVRGGRPGGRGCTRPRAQRAGAPLRRRAAPWGHRTDPALRGRAEAMGVRAAPPPTAPRRGPRSRASSWGSAAGPARPWHLAVGSGAAERPGRARGGPRGVRPRGRSGAGAPRGDSAAPFLRAGLRGASSSSLSL